MNTDYPETTTISLYLMLNMNTSEIIFTHPLSLWNKLDNNIQNSGTVSSFKKQILKFIRPSPNSTFNVHNLHGIKVFPRSRVGLSYLRE